MEELKERLLDPAEALNYYQSAVNTDDQAISCSPDYVDDLNNKGFCLKNLGD